MNDESEKDSTSIVPSVSNRLTKASSQLILRGLSELSRLEPERLVVPEHQRGRILLCDDQEAIVEVAQTMLSAVGHEVRSTLNSLEVIDIARRFEPHVAFIGEIMPRMDGFKLAPKLAKSFPQTKIVLWGEAEPSDLEIFREKGWPFDIFIVPFEKEELYEKTGKWVAEAKFYDLATGIYNARHFGFILDTETHRSQKYGYSFSIIFCKLRPSLHLQDDHDSIWKQSRLLRKVADEVKSLGRLIDFAFYLGDCEFVMLLPQTTKDSATIVSERLRRILQESEWEYEQGTRIELGAVISVASFPEDGRTKQELLDHLSQ